MNRKEKIKDTIIFMIDTGANRTCIEEQVSGKRFYTEQRLKSMLELDDVPLQQEVAECIDELIRDDKVVSDNNFLIVTEFMPRTASKITGKNYR